MAIINQSNILNLQPGITAPVVVHMSEGDSGTKLSFKLIDGARAWTDPGNVVAAVHGRRQDGTQFGPYACTISGDVVSFQTDAAIAAAAGSGIAQIVLTDSDQNTAGTANFAIMVERATFPMGVTYTNDKSVYEAILAYVQTIPAAVTEDYTAKIDAEASARRAADAELEANVGTLQNALTSEVATRSAQDAVLSARMDEFTKLPDGSLSTAADAELADIRVKANGTTAATAGDAVREQITELSNDLTSVMRLENTDLLGGQAWEIGSININDGSDITATNRIRTVGYVDLRGASKLSFTIDTGYKFVIDWYDANHEVNKVTPFGVWNTANLSIFVPENVAYMRLLVSDTADGRASVEYAQHLAVEADYSLVETITRLQDNEDKILKPLTDYNPPFTYMDVVLEKGGYDVNGNEQEDTSGVRWRTPNYIYVSDMANTEIDVPDGFTMYVCLYGNGNVFKERNTWASGSTHNVAEQYSIRWTIVKNTWDPITLEEANCVSIKNKIPWYEYLSNGLNPLSEYPSYYDSQIKAVASNFVNDMLSVGANGDGFAFLTDVHWSGNYKHSPNLLYYLKENTNLDIILCGGDLIDRSITSKSSQIIEMQNCVKTFKQVGIPFVTAIGNHERNSAGVTDSTLYLTENEVFSITQNPVNWMPLNYAGFIDRICFYYDKTATKTRYIFIDSGQNNIGTFDITDDEITWVETVVSDTQSDYHIVVIVHSLGEYSSLNDPISESNPFVYTSGATKLLNALDALKESHLIEAVFVGHTHVDNNAETTGGIPIIWTNSDAIWQYHGMSQPSDGTVAAQCFDVVTMDYANKKIYLRRVGRGADRIISY